ncbi:hypothetical protein Cgig2_015676 [Carnegiea gigantea]|uniref:F-box domain-containing protein n=1 Tax=Carnegiea gigantea TaxID=171969 RepID=A0A9Q1GVL3_9CARY|nr:hypothetical protein Cgig2_015676 [Carnegiea gigantea]
MADNDPISLIPGLPFDMAIECLLRVPITSHPTLRLVSHGFHSAISDPSFFHHRRRLGFAEKLLFLLQPPPQQPLPIEKDTPGLPLYKLNIYNFTRSEWQRVALPIPTFAQCAAVPAEGKVVVLGGWDPLTFEPVSKVLVFDLLNGTWKEGSPMPEKRSFFACAAVGPTTIYVAGGHDGRKNALKSAAAYDVVLDEWRVLPEMTEERDECHGLSFDGSKFWVVSGYGTENQGRFRLDCEVFAPETESWTRIDGVWPNPSAAPRTAAAGGGGRWLMVGEGEVREFDWEERRWKGLDLGRLPKRISGSSSNLIVDVGDGDGDGDGEIIVMGNGENCEAGCDVLGCGDGAFILERNNKEMAHGNGYNKGIEILAVLVHPFQGEGEVRVYLHLETAVAHKLNVGPWPIKWR